MNVFVTSPCPESCAHALDDLRLNKMILETAQLLSTAHHVIDGVLAQPGLYKVTHVNHPCAIWARESVANYRWLYHHFVSLSCEYALRTGKLHATWNQLAIPLLTAPLCLEYASHTPWPNCTPYKDVADVHEAYRLTMRDKWLADKRPPRWTGRKPPSWR